MTTDIKERACMWWRKAKKSVRGSVNTFSVPLFVLSPATDLRVMSPARSFCAVNICALGYVGRLARSGAGHALQMQKKP